MAHPSSADRRGGSFGLLLLISLLALAAASSAGASGCYKVDNAGYCCLSNCDGHGGMATCPMGLTCDETKFACYDPTNGGACQGPQDCAGTMTPYCVNKKCVQCADSTMGCSAKDPVCSAANACTGCTTENDCTPYAQSGTPHCGSAGACVACRDATDCTDPHAPVCDQSACRACQADVDCPSAACDKETGACVAESAIIYLAPNGATTGTCTKTAPCATFAQGIGQLGGVRNVIKAAPGDYTGQIALTNITVTIYGDGATIAPSTSGQSVVAINDGVNVTIQGLHVTGAGGVGNPPGISCTGTTSSTMRLHRMRIDKNSGGGVEIYKCAFELLNNFIVANGSDVGQSAFGGVAIDATRIGDMTVLDFNTVAGNTAQAGKVTGVACSGSISTTPTFDSNIIYGNLVSGGGTQVDSKCNYTYSDISDTTSGAGNITLDPSFKAPASGDYHLGTGSKAIDAANPNSTLGVDYDGDKRPKGAARDIGADEAM